MPQAASPPASRRARRQNFGEWHTRQRIEHSIRAGWIAAAIFALAPLVGGILSAAAGEAGAWSLLLEAGIRGVLAFGVYRRNLVAAVVLVLYFLLAWISNGLFLGIIVNVILLAIFVAAAQGIREDKKIRAREARDAASPAA